MVKSGPAARKRPGPWPTPLGGADVSKRIRYLSPSEEPPTGEPRRYKASHGYVRLRWKTDGGYVEAWEHRVVAGASRGQHVHHKNGIKDDNRPENLEVLTPEAHLKHHAIANRLPDAEIVAMYESGGTTLSIAAALGCDPGAVSKVLKRNGVQTRTSLDYKTIEMPQDVAQLHALGWSANRIAHKYGVSPTTVGRWFDRLNLPRSRPGRRKGNRGEHKHGLPEWSSA